GRRCGGGKVGHGLTIVPARTGADKQVPSRVASTPTASQTPLIPAHSASKTRVNALLLGIQGQGLGPRNGVPATRASRGAPRGDERKRGTHRRACVPRAGDDA